MKQCTLAPARAALIAAQSTVSLTRSASVTTNHHLCVRSLSGQPLAMRCAWAPLLVVLLVGLQGRALALECSELG